MPLPLEFEPGTDLSESNIRWACQTYIDQLTTRSQSPGRGLDSPIGGPDTGELECRIHGSAFWVEPLSDVEIAGGALGEVFTLREMIDALGGVIAAAGTSTTYHQEAEITVLIDSREVASIWMLNKFRSKYVPFGTACVDINFGPISGAANATVVDAAMRKATMPNAMMGGRPGMVSEV